LLTRDGRLSAVLDFGELGIGDPARDLMITYTLLSAKTREAFRSALGVDDATWARGRGWALTTGLNAYVSYAAVNPWVAAATRRQVQETTGWSARRRPRARGRRRAPYVSTNLSTNRSRSGAGRVTANITRRRRLAQFTGPPPQLAISGTTYAD